MLLVTCSFTKFLTWISNDISISRFPKQKERKTRWKKEKTELSATKEVCCTFGKHSNPPPVALSKARESNRLGAIAANLQAIIDPVFNDIHQRTIKTTLTDEDNQGIRQLGT